MVFEKVRKLLAEQLEIAPESISAGTNIVEELGADSLDVMELITNIEEEFGLIITDETIGSLVTVGEIVEFIEKLL